MVVFTLLVALCYNYKIILNIYSYFNISTYTTCLIIKLVIGVEMIGYLKLSRTLIFRQIGKMIIFAIYIYVYQTYNFNNNEIKRF